MARPTRPRNVNRYSPEFKLKAVKLSQIDGVQVKEIAEALDIHPYMLSRWRKEAREGRIKARVGVDPTARQRREASELSALKREHALLKEEHELLKKAIRFSSAQRARSSRSSKPRGAASG